MVSVEFGVCAVPMHQAIFPLHVIETDIDIATISDTNHTIIQGSYKVMIEYIYISHG